MGDEQTATAAPHGALPVLLQAKPVAVNKGRGLRETETVLGNPDKQSGQLKLQAESHAKRHPAPAPRYMYFIAACASLNSVNLGFDVGVSSGVGIYIEEQLQLTDLQVGVFFGSLHFVAAVGGLASQALSDKLGRRLTFTVAQLINILGLALVCVAESFAVLMMGRVIVGLGVGISLSIDPLYIAEAAPAEHRGKLTTWSELAINLGIMLGFIVNWAFDGLPSSISWRLMVGCGGVLPFVLIVLSQTVMPESPRWLVSRGRISEATEIVRRTHAEGEDVDAVVGAMRQGMLEEKANKSEGWAALMKKDQGTRKAILVGLGVALAQQLNGSESVIFYSPTIFKRGHVASTKQSLFAVTILVGLVKTTFVAISAYFLDNVGRRPLLVTSTSCMAMSLAALSLGSALGVGWLAVLAVLSFVASFSLGIGPVCWLLVAELFPSQVRAKAMSLGVFLNRLTSATVALTFLPLSSALGGQSAYFGFFSVVTACTAVAAFLMVPETKRLTLEEVSQRKGMGMGMGTTQKQADAGADTEAGQQQQQC